MRLLLSLMFLLMMANCGLQSEKSEIDRVSAEMISLIDQHKGQELLAKYAYLDNVNYPIYDVSEDKLKEIRFVLLKIQEMNPKLSEDRAIAIYESKAFARPVRFIKHDGKWLLMDE